MSCCLLSDVCMFACCMNKFKKLGLLSNLNLFEEEKEEEEGEMKRLNNFNVMLVDETVHYYYYYYGCLLSM